MSIMFNHTIIAAKDKKRSATWLTELFNLPDPEPFGHFLTVTVANDVSLDYAEVPDGEDIHPQHYAFLVSEDDFDAIYGKIGERGIEHWADPGRSRAGEINRNDGGRGVYFQDPAGHYMEILTRPYGSGG
jgi:extradiol dioxygenase family protein